VNTEKLPTYSRNLKFRLTVRDNNAGAGGTNSALVSFEVDGNAGPFLVTAPNTCVTWNAGSTQTITWDVANTGAGTLVDCQNVKISLSVDGGYTYDYVLAASTPNDGSHAITLPSGVCSNQARIKIEAEGNIFFDVSDLNFIIDDGTPLVNLPRVLVLDGLDDYAEIDNSTLGDFGIGDFTIEMWVKTDANGDNPLINKREVCNIGKSWMFYLEDGIVKGEFRDDPGSVSALGITGVASINDGAWHHLAITRAGNTVRIYIDGQLDNTNTAGDPQRH